MHTIDLLHRAIAEVTNLGYLVRQEWLGGNGGGGCELRGKKFLFLDLDLSPVEQLEQVLELLRRELEADRAAPAAAPPSASQSATSAGHGGAPRPLRKSA